MTEAEKDPKSLVYQFNQRYGIGQRVLLSRPGREPLATTTRSRAFLLRGTDEVVVGVEGIPGYMPLSWITVIAEGGVPDAIAPVEKKEAQVDGRGVESIIDSLISRCNRLDALLTMISSHPDYEARRKSDIAFDAAWHDAAHALKGLPGFAYYFRILGEQVQEAAALKKQLADAQLEIATDNELITDGNSVLDALPCPAHGRCVPYAIDRIKELLSVERRCAEAPAGPCYTLADGSCISPFHCMHGDGLSLDEFVRRLVNAGFHA